MPVTFRHGTKWADDLKCAWVCEKCNNFEDVTFHNLAFVIVELCKNESRGFPPENGLRGGQMLLDFFQEAYEAGMISDDLLRRYKLNRDNRQTLWLSK